MKIKVLNFVQIFNKKSNLIILLIVIPFWSVNSQNGYVKINKSEKLEKIILLKKDLNSKIENLKIQIYNGNREQAEKIKEEYIEKFNDSVVKIIYETPNYKVWVGSFFTQLEADKFLLKVRKKFKSAFIFRPEYLSDDNNEENIN
tara:strand:- start:6717 stop:7151 length:435 start_codon:yes stop_codon:yes gene_type:complete